MEKDHEMVLAGHDINSYHVESSNISEIAYDDIEIEALEDISDWVIDDEQDSPQEILATAADEPIPEEIISRENISAEIISAESSPIISKPEEKALDSETLAMLAELNRLEEQENQAKQPTSRLFSANAPTQKLPSLPEILSGKYSSSTPTEKVPEPPETMTAPSASTPIAKKSAGVLVLSKLPAQPAENSAETIDGDARQTLGEVSFMEGEEAEARGDRNGAISHFRIALAYAPDKIKIYLQLAELLAEEPATFTEAEQLLSRAIELSPNNMDLRARLVNLRDYATKKREWSNSKRTTQNLTGKLPASMLAATEFNFADARTMEVPVVKSIAKDNQSQAKAGKTNRARLKRGKFVIPEIIALPKRISMTNWLILITTIIFLTGSIAYALSSRDEKIQVLLVTPPDDVLLRTERIDFTWKSAANNYIIQFEENGKPLFERFCKESTYALTPEDLKFFKPERRYTWRVIPVDFQRKPLPTNNDEFQFKVLPVPATQLGGEENKTIKSAESFGNFKPQKPNQQPNQQPNQ